jgi:cytochrome c oxidase subunit II
LDIDLIKDISVSASVKTGFTSLAAILAAPAALAAQPQDWQMTLQPAATEIMASMVWFEQYTLWLMAAVTVFVAALLVYVCVKFKASSNPTPSRTTHNATIEVIWTVVPVLILLAIAFPSFQLLNAQYAPPREAELTIKATGNQWYWGYEYQVADAPISFEANLLKDEERSAFGKEDKAAYPRQLAVDNEVVVPVDTVVRVLVTAGDVLHAFAMPAFGIKSDAVPGRLNETWFLAEKEGLYYGQCSEICGKDHSNMPIAIRVVSKQDYSSWATAAATDVSLANKTLMASLKAKNAVAAAD